MPAHLWDVEGDASRCAVLSSRPGCHPGSLTAAYRQLQVGVDQLRLLALMEGWGLGAHLLGGSGLLLVCWDGGVPVPHFLVGLLGSQGCCSYCCLAGFCRFSFRIGCWRFGWNDCLNGQGQPGVGGGVNCAVGYHCFHCIGDGLCYHPVADTTGTLGLQWLCGVP